MTIDTLEISFDADSGAELKGRLIVPSPSDTSTFPTVIMMTGDGPKGSKSLSWVNLPPRLANLGYASFVFDFEGLGYSEGDRRDLTLSRGLGNARRAVDQVFQTDRVDTSRVGIFGASFGGNVAILLAGNDDRIKALGLKSPVSFYPESLVTEYGLRETIDWLETGSNDHVPFRRDMYFDAFGHSTYASALGIRCPCLISHGSADRVVPINQSRHLYYALSGADSRKLEVFEGIGHGYSEEGAWEKMASMFIDWFVAIL